MKKRSAGNSTGSSLVLSLMIMALFSMMAVIVYAAAKSMTGEALYYERSAQAQSIAEAGLEDAMHSLYLDSTWRTGFNKKPFAGGYYTVTLSTASSPVIASTGYSSAFVLTGPAVRTVSATAVFVSTGSTTYADLSSDLHVWPGGRIDAYDPRVSLTPSSGSFVNTGTLWSNQVATDPTTFNPPIAPCTNPRIFSNIIHLSSDLLLGTGCVSGTVVSTTTAVNIPLTLCGTCKTANNDSVGISPASAYSSGSLTVGSGKTVRLSSGTYYFTNISINGTLNVDTSSGPVKIFYGGNFTEGTSTCTINNLSLIPSRLLIAGIGSNQTANLTCPGSLRAYLEGDIATGIYHIGPMPGTVPVELYGHVYAYKLFLENGGKLHFDLGNGVTSHVAWTMGTSLGSWSASYKRQ